MRMTRKILPGLATAILLAVGTLPALAADPVGTWLTAEGNAKVRIADCGGALCGTIVSLKEPTDPATGKAKTDKNNADAGKRARPLVGVQIVFGLKPSGTPDKWAGQVYNAEDGKTYTGYVTMTAANALKLEGCALAGLVCKAQNWTRTN
jgi:uncharacterized protein (DUF2147 family)